MSGKLNNTLDAALTEEAWWDQHGDLQERIWHYDEKLTKIVRGGYLADMEQFLFKPNGRLLEFGCGTGWVGLRLAQRGMFLDGVDLSGEQISRARCKVEKMGIANASFRQGGIDQISTEAEYDGVVLHALLHHLNREKIKVLFGRLRQALRPGGRIYAYEPIAARANPPIGAWVLDKTTLLAIRSLRTLVFGLGIQDPKIRNAIKNGWHMRSPEESPIHLDDLEDLLSEGLNIIDVAYWHMLAVAYANLCMGLKPYWRGVLSEFAPVFVLIDRMILRLPQRVYLKAWPMAGIKIIAP